MAYREVKICQKRQSFAKLWRCYLFSHLNKDVNKCLSSPDQVKKRSDYAWDAVAGTIYSDQAAVQAFWFLRATFLAQKERKNYRHELYWIIVFIMTILHLIIFWDWIFRLIQLLLWDSLGKRHFCTRSLKRIAILSTVATIVTWMPRKVAAMRCYSRRFSWCTSLCT